MNEIKLNETPKRTSKNFNINNIKLTNVEIPNQIENFNSTQIINNTSEIVIENNVSNINLKYGLSQLLTNQVKEKSNYKAKIIINNIKEINKNRQLQINFKFDDKNISLLENIEIIAKEDTNATIILKYESNEDINAFHNGIIRLIAKKNSNINIIIVNLLSLKSNNFISIENNFEGNAKAKYTIIDFGGKNSITNYYSNLEEDSSKNIVNTMYLGKENQLFDLNYIAELRGQNSNINIEVQGALNEKSIKHFKGTIDFKKGSKKAKGNENEYCMLLSDTAKSLSLPMLLCSEEDVEGNHSSSSGKVGEKELFYIMSRGFNLKEALKLVVKAKFSSIIQNIEDENLKNRILEEIDKKIE